MATLNSKDKYKEVCWSLSCSSFAVRCAGVSAFHFPTVSVLGILGSMNTLEKSSTRLFQVCFLHLWNCLTRLIWFLFDCASTPSDPQQSGSVSLPQIRITFCKKSVFCAMSTWAEPSASKPFQASGGGTLNINPHGNFVLNVQFGNRS